MCGPSGSCTADMPMILRLHMSSGPKWTATPIALLTQHGLPPGMTLADIGAGEGTVAFRAIERVGPSLRVLLTYSNCVDSTVNDVMRRYAGVASASDLQTLKSLGIKLHNSALDKDQALANRLNQQIRVFKASVARSGQNDTGTNTR